MHPGMQVSYETHSSIGRLRREMDLLNAEEFMEVLQRGYDNASKYRDYAPGMEPILTRTDPRLFDANGNPRYDTNWQREATRTAFSHNHQLNLRQGGENSSIGAFLNYTDREGIMLNSWMRRANARLVYDATPRNWISLGTNMMVNHTWENNVEEGGGHQMPRRTIIEMPPIFPVRFEDGSWSNSFAIEDDYGTEAMANPVHVLQTQERLNNRNQIFGNTYLTFHILPGLDFRTQIGIDRHSNEWRYYSPRDLINLSAPNARADIANTEILYWQQENFLTFDNVIGSHSINTVLGLSWQERSYRWNGMGAEGFADDFFRYHNIGAATTPVPPSSNANKWAMNSYFLRASYTLQGKVFGNLHRKDRWLVKVWGRQ
jgi:TonB-dependent starch-binding outer membrane protein SusC